MAAELLAEVEEELEAVSESFPVACRYNSSKRVLTLTFHAAEARILLPSDYPTSAPTVSLDPPVGVTKTSVDELMEELDEIFKDYAGMGVLFNTVMVIEAASQRWHEELSCAEPSCTPAAWSDAPAAAPNEAAPKAAVLPSCPTIVTVDPIVERKSTFLGHAAEVHSVEEVQQVMARLLEDNHIARATHNMMAYRLFDEGAGVWRSDNDEDGEDAAGGRLSMLLEMMQVRHAVVVVTRWYGGVLLGPSRFKLISNAARQALLAAGLSGRNE